MWTKYSHLSFEQFLETYFKGDFEAEVFVRRYFESLADKTEETLDDWQRLQMELEDAEDRENDLNDDLNTAWAKIDNLMDQIDKLENDLIELEATK